MIYLDNAATSFQKPECVKKAVFYAINNFASPGRGGYKFSTDASSIVFSAREALAGLFNIKTPENIIFTNNATTSINIALKGLLRPYDKVFTSSMEHNAVARPLESLSKKGCDVSYIAADSNGYISPVDVKNALTPDTRLLCLIHSSNVSGSKNDIDAIGKAAKANGTIFMVDASQSAGSSDINVERSGIDILAVPGHKGLLGPCGTGALYIRSGLSLAPLTEGGTGSMSESLLQPDIFPDRFESGTLNVPGISGLLAGVKFIKKLTPTAIGEYECALTASLAEDLSVIKGVKLIGDPFSKSRSAVLSIVTPIDCITLSDELYKKYGICARAGLHCAPLAHKTLGTFDSGTVRFSPGIFTRREDIKKTALAISRCLKQI